MTLDYSKCMYCGVETGDFYVCDKCSSHDEEDWYEGLRNDLQEEVSEV